MCGRTLLQYLLIRQFTILNRKFQPPSITSASPALLKGNALFDLNALPCLRSQSVSDRVRFQACPQFLAQCSISGTVLSSAVLCFEPWVLSIPHIQTFPNLSIPAFATFYPASPHPPNLLLSMMQPGNAPSKVTLKRIH